jgi:hypothetical protein
LGEALPSTVSAEDKPSLFDRFTGVGSEEALIEELASVRLTNRICSFPASGFYERAFAI